MSILALAFFVPFALLLVFVAISAARRGNAGRGDRSGPVFWSSDGGGSYSDSGPASDCGGGSGDGGSCDGGGGH